MAVNAFKNRVLQCLVTLAFLVGVFVVPAAAHADPKYASLVIDAETGVVLHQENAGELRYPASLTKMMTLYMTFQALERGKLRLDQPLKVSKHASGQAPSKMGLKPGETILLRDALLAVIIKSANDVAVVLADAVGGSESKFATQMTNMARKLGMKHTTFMNASGLHNSRQKTTAYDLARLAVALRRDYPQYYPLFARSEFKFRGQTYTTHNRVSKNYPGADGLKTGFVNASGFNLVTSARRDGKSVVGVVMGGRSWQRRDRNMMDLLDKAFYKMAKSKKGGKVIGNAIVPNSVSGRSFVSVKKDVPLPILKPGGDAESLQAENDDLPVPELKPVIQSEVIKASEDFNTNG